jgi:hypothetical protein
MPDVSFHCRFGPVRVGVLPHPHGVAAETLARGWLADGRGRQAATQEF